MVFGLELLVHTKMQKDPANKGILKKREDKTNGKKSEKNDDVKGEKKKKIKGKDGTTEKNKTDDEKRGRGRDKIRIYKEKMQSV